MLAVLLRGLLLEREDLLVLLVERLAQVEKLATRDTARLRRPVASLVFSSSTSRAGGRPRPPRDATSRASLRTSPSSRSSSPARARVRTEIDARLLVLGEVDARSAGGCFPAGARWAEDARWGARRGGGRLPARLHHGLRRHRLRRAVVDGASLGHRDAGTRRLLPREAAEGGVGECVDVCVDRLDVARRRRRDGHTRRRTRRDLRPLVVGHVVRVADLDLVVDDDRRVGLPGAAGHRAPRRPGCAGAARRRRWACGRSPRRASAASCAARTSRRSTRST